MRDGRRKRVMVACVTFETIRITDPIAYYESTRVHLIHYISNSSDSKDVYQDFYDAVCDNIRTISNKIEIVEHIANVTDFSVMMKVVHSILTEERESDPNSDLFVNISAGSSEYVAAAAITAMMFHGTIPFSVPTSEYTIDAKQYYDSETNKPIGLAKKVRFPQPVPQFCIDSPDKNLVLGLKILHQMNKNPRYPKNSDMIKELKKNGLWFRGEFPENSASRSEAVYYLRDYVDKWDREGWIYHDKYVKKYFLSEKGKSIIDTFYCDCDIDL